MKDTRERLVAAAEQILREQGLAHFSVREVARLAGVAEGAMYRHFTDKSELILAVIQLHGPQYFEGVRNLPLQVGQGTVRDNLREVTWLIYDFVRYTLPIAGSLFADLELLERHRAVLRAHGGGPLRTKEALAIYLAAEQRAGRVRKDADVQAAALMLLGSCLQLAYLQTYWGEKISPAKAREQLHAAVDVLMPALA